MSKDVKEYITLFQEFFNEISKEELSIVLSKIESRKYHGITVIDYLQSIESNIDVLTGFHGHNEIITHFENSEHNNIPIPSSLANGGIKSGYTLNIELEQYSSPILFNEVQGFSGDVEDHASYVPGGDNESYRLAA